MSGTAGVGGDRAAASPVTPKPAPKVKWVVAAYVLAAVSIVVGHVIDAGSGDIALMVKSDFSIFAVFYAFAQAEERLLEPVSRLWGATDRETATQEAAGASATQREAQAAAVALTVAGKPDEASAQVEAATTAAKGEAEEQAKIAQLRANKEVFLWGVATAIAAVACGALGIRFLEVLLDFGTKQATGAFRFFDLGLTALVIGSGTKPLHDLIDRLQKPKQGTQ